MKKYLEEFVTLCCDRLERGSKEKQNAYSEIDLYQQIVEELADISNYAFLEYMKVRNLKTMKDKFVKEKTNA